MNYIFVNLVSIDVLIEAEFERHNTDWSDSIKKSRAGVEGYDLPPLTESLKSGRKLKFPERLSSRNYDTDVTQLGNGLRVASEKLFGEFCTVGGQF